MSLRPQYWQHGMRAEIGSFLIRLGHRIGGPSSIDVRTKGRDAGPNNFPRPHNEALQAAIAVPPMLAQGPQEAGAFPPSNITEATDSPQQQVRQLIKKALETPTIEQVTEFLDFTNRFRRLAVWNARMAYIQRPGAEAIASEGEWMSIGREVLPDAVPIIILWPFSPIRFVYELADTGPLIDRERIGDPFAASGKFEPKTLIELIVNLAKAKTFKVTVEYRRQGFRYAGSAATQGELPGIANGQLSVLGQSTIGQFAIENPAVVDVTGRSAVPAYRVTLNDRLNEKERFITLVHELGHIFCGQLGACLSGSGRDDEETGWPDRRNLGKNEKEVEAEAVAYLIAARAGLVTASAAYLRGHAKQADTQKLNLDLVVRAATRIERLGKIHYGTMAFGRPIG